MAITKRIRYEVLRRDGHTCRYCHATDSPLTVDHVVPVALGGSDTADNLVAACRDCNAGKSSANPDASLVADVREDALRHAEMVRQAYAVLVARMGDRDRYVGDIGYEFAGTLVPADWRQTIGRWYEMGVPLELVEDAAQIALKSPKQFQPGGRFKYMCGIVWNQVTAVDYVTSLIGAVGGSFMTDDEKQEFEEEAWRRGYDNGHMRALTSAGVID